MICWLVSVSVQVCHFTVNLDSVTTPPRLWMFQYRFRCCIQLLVQEPYPPLHFGRLHKVEIEELFQGIQQPFRFAGLDVNYLSCVLVLDGMGCKVAYGPDSF